MFVLKRSFHSSKAVLNVANVKLTLFSKQQCGLCDTAKSVMDQVVQQPKYRSCKYEIVDIMDPDNKEWYDKYCFDVPVLHVQNAETETLNVEKLFHRFDEKKVQDIIEKFT